MIYEASASLLVRYFENINGVKQRVSRNYATAMESITAQRRHQRSLCGMNICGPRASLSGESVVPFGVVAQPGTVLQSKAIAGFRQIEEVSPVSRKRKKLQGTVQKIIQPTVPHEPEKAQINIDGADDLYREIRIENVVTDQNGKEARLKPGAEVDVIVEADSSATIKKPENP
jgi:hypothetical protein